MVCQVRHKDSKTGRIYVYESTSHWDKTKKQCVCTRNCIGHIKEGTEDIIVPNRKRVKRSTVSPQIKGVGASLFLDKICGRIGLVSTLQEVFPDSWHAILTCAYFLITENKALSRCENWSKTNVTPSDKCLTSQSISRLLKTLTLTEQYSFFHHWVTKARDDEYFALDITSISSYSKLIETIKYGYNRDKEKLPQINLAMIVGIHSGLPIFFRYLNGNITDVTTLKNTANECKWLHPKTLHFVMDKGFCDYGNVSELYSLKFKFTIGMSKSMDFTIDAIKEVADDIKKFDNSIEFGKDIYYVKTLLKNWDKHRCYVHVYFNNTASAEDEDDFMRDIHQYKKELESGEKLIAHEKQYQKYFTIKETPVRGLQVKPKSDVIDADNKTTAGFFVLLTNDLKSPIDALKAYREKDTVEKTFDNLKNDLDGKRLRIHSKEAMEGRLFIQFIGLIIKSEIKNILVNKELEKEYSIPDIMWEMKSLNMIKYPNKSKIEYGELTAQQKQIMKIFEIKLDS